MSLKQDIILLIGHGSRENSGNQEIRDFADQWRTQQPDWQIEVCFIEFSSPSVSDGLRMAAKSSRRVLVLPLVLNAAAHVKMEIPEAIEHARKDCPQTEFLMAPNLTACDPILHILKRNLRKAMTALDMPDPKTTGVIVLSRGSSERDANGDMAKMARWLQEDGAHELVDLAFTGITWPRLERVVQRQVILGMRQIVVLPYYLYTGVLMKRIHLQIEHLKRQYPLVRFTSTTHFGLEKEIFQLANQRVVDLQSGGTNSTLPYDGCSYRENAHGLGHGHSHEQQQPVPVALHRSGADQLV